MKEIQRETVAEEFILENKNEARFKDIEIGLLKRKIQTCIGFGFKRIEIETFGISDYLVLNYGKRK